MKYLVIVTADGNDADYQDRSEFIEPDQLPFVRKIAAAIKAYPERHNWTRDCDLGRGIYGDKSLKEKYANVLTEEEIEKWIDEFMPYNEYGIHTINNIQLIEVANHEELFK